MLRFLKRKQKQKNIRKEGAQIYGTAKTIFFRLLLLAWTQRFVFKQRHIGWTANNKPTTSTRMYRLLGYLHNDIVKYKLRATIWTFFGELPYKLHIVSSDWYFTISIRRISEYLFIVQKCNLSFSPPEESFTLDESKLDNVSCHIVTSCLISSQGCDMKTTERLSRVI